MAVVFNEDGVIKQVKPNLKNTKTHLTSAKTIFSSLDIPHDFKYANLLKKYPQDITDIQEEVKSIEKWLDKTIADFKNVESSTNKAINKVGSTYNQVNEMGNKTISNTTQKISEIIETFGETIEKSIMDSIDKKVESMSEEEINEDWKLYLERNLEINEVFSNFLNSEYSKEEAVKSYTEEIDKQVAKMYNIPIEEVTTDLRVKMVMYNEELQKRKEENNKSVVEQVGDAISSVGDGILSVGASLGNSVVSIFKGVGEFGEGIVDTVAMLGTAIFSPFTGIFDGITYLMDGGEDWESVTAKMWKGTMGFVAEGHVDNFFGGFYKNTALGKWLDEHAFEPFKSNGMACNILSGIGYVGGIVALTIGTLGIGSIAGVVSISATSITTVSAGIATAAGTEKYTSEYWAQKRDSSWEGIERFYEKGEISEEQYNSYKMIRSLNDEQWEEIEIDYKNGNLTKEQYEQIKQIRELPEDWATLENGLKGFTYGATNGIWEGIQWYVGGKLAGSILSATSSPLVNSAIRVSADTGLNALDTPFRTTLESITSGEDWEQAWINQGGWQSVLANVGIGLVGSVGGEAVDLSKIKKGMATLNNSKLFENVDKSTADKVKVAIMNDYTSGKVDITKTVSAKVDNVPTIEKFSDFIATKNGDLFEGIDDTVATKVMEKMACDYLNGKIKLSRKELQKYISDLNSIKTIDDAIELSIKKQGKQPTDELIKKYRTEVKNGNYNLITKENGARKFIDEYFHTEIKTIDDAIELTLKSSNSKTLDIDARRTKIQEALADGKFEYITNDCGARQVVENIYKTKVKKYLALQTNDKIFQYYGGFSYETGECVRQTLQYLLYAITGEKINKNMNFFEYLQKQAIGKTAKNEIANYQKYNTWFRKLTVGEAHSINAYTAGSTQIQQYLGTGQYDFKYDIKPYLKSETQMKNIIAEMDSALDKGEVLTINKVFYRGDDYGKLKNWGFPDYATLKAKEGETFTCDNYISSGVSKEGAFGGEVQWTFKCDAGKNYGSYVNEISEYMQCEMEYEYLIKRGAKIKLNKVSLKDGITYIDASIIGFSPKALK